MHVFADWLHFHPAGLPVIGQDSEAPYWIFTVTLVRSVPGATVIVRKYRSGSILPATSFSRFSSSFGFGAGGASRVSESSSYRRPDFGGDGEGAVGRSAAGRVREGDRHRRRRGRVGRSTGAALAVSRLDAGPAGRVATHWPSQRLAVLEPDRHRLVVPGRDLEGDQPLRAGRGLLDDHDPSARGEDQRERRLPAGR